jgi:ribulose 1,5-bisphosphate synthetase/thiazole synthase
VTTQIIQVPDNQKLSPKLHAVVGSGPSGLFASLVLAELGADVTLIEITLIEKGHAIR